MFEIKVIEHFNAAHNLRNYCGKCEKLHGHTWKVEVFIEGDKLSDIGLLIDFKDVKKELSKVINILDHRYINEVSPFDKINPTAENIAFFVFKKLKETFKNISKVSVWESSTSCATYKN
jgi:6-pyruvoyltetrahydropterin/6-carboxytetrahydropterin synthase